MDTTAIIPTHARPHLLVQAVDSVLNQTLPPVEVIVVSDGSDSDKVENALGERPVRLLRSEGCGVAAARNLALSAARTRWVSFLDDDDLWHPDHLCCTGAFLGDHPDVRAVNAPVWTFSESSGVGADLIASDLASCLAAAATSLVQSDCSYLEITGRSFDKLLERNASSINTTTVDRDLLLEAGGFPTGYTCAEDWVMAINVARYTEWHVIPRRLAFHRIHAGNNTTGRSLTNGLVTLAAIRNVWSDDTRPWPSHRPLEAYGKWYRFVLQGSLWDCLRRLQPRLAFKFLPVAAGLLPKRVDLLYCLIPPPITWRAQKYLGRLDRSD